MAITCSATGWRCRTCGSGRGSASPGTSAGWFGVRRGRPRSRAASGAFPLRPAARAELLAAVSGFLRIVYFDEGERVPAGALVACLEVPDLESRLAQSKAALRESRAKLRLLEVGPRPEEVREQRYRVERAKEWRDLAEKDLALARKALTEDLKRL